MHGIEGGGWGGWNKKVAMWDWHEECIKGYPGWELDNGHPPSAFLNLIHGEGLSSAKIAAKFDDVATSKWYYRDYTEDTIPFVREGDKYSSRFWFSSRFDKLRFLGMFHMAINE